MAEFKDRLKIAMDNKKIKSIELAEKVNCSRSLISQYLSGKCKAKQDLIYLIAKELEVKPSWLMGIDVEKPSSTYNNICNRLKYMSEENLEKIYNIIDLMFPDGEDKE